MGGLLPQGGWTGTAILVTIACGCGGAGSSGFPGVSVGQALQIRGCFLGDAGLVDARGSGTALPVGSSRGWLSLGASSQFEFPAGARFAVRLVAGAQAPLRRDRYAFGAVDFFEVPVVIATGRCRRGVLLVS